MGARILLAASAALLASAGSATAEGNLAGNPDFESTQLATWSQGWSDFPTYQGIWAAELATITGPELGVTPKGGARMLRIRETGGVVSQVMQPIDVSGGSVNTLILSGSAFARFQAWFNAPATASPQLQASLGIHFFSAANQQSLIQPATYAGLSLDADPTTWEGLSHVVDVPWNTRWIVVELSYANGSFVDVDRAYVDDAGLFVAAFTTCETFCDANGIDATPCPCGNDNDSTAPDRLAAGCDNSRPNHTGGMLRCHGTTSVSAGPDVYLEASNVQPGATGIFYRADDMVAFGRGKPFGGGLVCIETNRVQIELVPSVGAGGTTPTTVDLTGGTFPFPGDSELYQFWWRDVGTPCGSISTILPQFTNGVRLWWTP